MVELGKREQIIILFLVGIILFGGGYKLAEKKIQEKPQIVKAETDLEEGLEKKESNSPTEGEKEMIMVHITGAVESPGVYQLLAGARVNDALKLAVPKEGAYLDRINLAQILQDQDQIIIPDNIDDQYVPSNNDSSPFGGVISYSNNSSGKININIADENSLQTLRGIGPVLSKRIVDYRQENGSFKSIEEIKNVSGIGENKFEDIKELISIK